MKNLNEDKRASAVKISVEESCHDHGSNSLDLDYLDWWSKYFASVIDEDTPVTLIAESVDQAINPNLNEAIEEDDEYEEEDYENETYEIKDTSESIKKKRKSIRESKKKKIKKKLKKRLRPYEKKAAKKSTESTANENANNSDANKNIETIKVSH